MKGYMHPIFIAALFAIAKTSKQHKCPSTDEWINAFLRALPGGLGSACGAGRSGGGGPTRRPGRLRAAPTGLLVLGRPRALAWASDTQCARGASPRPRGLGQWAFQQLEEAGGPREGRLRQAGERGGKGRGQTFGFYKVKEIYFLRS